MLKPPGSSSGRNKNYQQRRKAQESPEQILRSLQRLAPNKRCADCNSKLPSCVNLTVGTFICISCAGIHREHNHRVKGIGHSSFTPEEAEQMKLIAGGLRPFLRPPGQSDRRLASIIDRLANPERVDGIKSARSLMDTIKRLEDSTYHEPAPEELAISSPI